MSILDNKNTNSMTYNDEPINIRTSFLGTEDLNAQSANSMLSLSKELSLPTNVIRSDMGFAQNEVKARKVETDPRLAMWASEKPENAAMVRDYTDDFLNVSSNLQNVIEEENKKTINDENAIVEDEDIGIIEKYITQPYERGQKQIKGIQAARAYLETGEEQYKAEAEKYKEEAMTYGQKELSWYEYLSPSVAIEQLPQMLEMLPTQLYRAGQGALSAGSLAFLAGQVGPQVAIPEEVITIPLATGIGAKTGWTIGTAESAFGLEKGAFAYELMDMKDLNGEPIPREVLDTFSTVYAAIASGIELSGEVAFISILEKSGLGKIASGTAKQATKQALKNALKDKTLQPIILDAAKRIAQVGVSGFVEEGLQKTVNNLVQAGMFEYIAETANTAFENVDFTEGVLEEAFMGLGASMWLSSPTVIMKSSYDYSKVRQQQNFTNKQNSIHETIEQLKTNVQNDEIVEDFLNRNFNEQLGQDVYVDAQAMQELMQEDSQLASDLNIDLVKLEEYAVAGVPYPLSLTKLHAKLDTQRYTNVSQIMKSNVEAYNQFDTDSFQERIEQDQTRIQEIQDTYYQEQADFEYELDSIRQNIEEAIAYSPALAQTIEVQGGKEKYIDAQIELVRRVASRLSEASNFSVSPVEILSRLQDIRTEVNIDKETLELETSKYEADKEFFDHVVGRIDRDSVISLDGVQTAKDLEYMYGRKLWAKKGQGFGLYQIGEQLKDVNLINYTDEIELNPYDFVIQKLSKGNNLWTKDNANKLRRQKRLGSVGKKADTEKPAGMSSPQNNLTSEPAQASHIEDITTLVENVKKAQEVLSENILIAPNGKPSNLSPELYETVRTEEFKAWFGDWENDPENASKVLDENGEPLVVYHGSGFKFDTFDKDKRGTTTNTGVSKRGFFFTSNLESAEIWAEHSYDKFETSDDIVYKTFLNIKSPNTINAQGKTFSQFQVSLNSSIQDAKELNRDGVIIQNIHDVPVNKTDDSYISNVYAVFEPTQIKSIKNRGTFSTESDNIYFQSDIENPLVVTHGINASNLIEADKLGGLPVPSLGISRADEVLTNFGNVILIGDTNLIENEPVYSNDIYSVRFPNIVYDKIPFSETKSLYNELQKIGDEIGEHSAAHTITYYMNDEANKDKAVSSFKSNTVSKLMFLRSIGEDVQTKHIDESEQVYAFPDIVDVVKRNKESFSIERGTELHKKLSEAYKKYIHSLQVSDKGKQLLLDRKIDETGELNFNASVTLQDDVNKYLNQKSQKIDKLQFAEDVDEKIKNYQEQFDEYTEKKVSSLFGNPKILQGKKKVDLTLDSIVNAMTGKKVVGREKTFGFSNGQLIATRAKKYKNIKEIQKNRNLIQSDNVAFDNYKTNIEELLSEFRSEVSQYSKYPNGFTVYDDAMIALSKITKKPTKEQLKTALQKYDFANVPESILEKGLEAIKEIDKGLVSYFEAKPQRAVVLSEFTGAVVPKNVNKQVLEVLDKNNIEYTFYDNSSELQNVVSQFTRELNAKNNNILFQNQKNARGKIQKLNDDNYIITLFSNANLSTLTHELAHFFFLEMQQLERNGLANEALQKDMDILREWVGAKKGEELNTEQQEMLARGFEQYLREGKAPVANLRNVFARFSKWLRSIYKHAMKLNVQTTDEVRSVFDRMLATEQEIEIASNKVNIIPFTNKEFSEIGSTEATKNFINSLTGDIKREAEEKLITSRQKARAELKKKVEQEATETIEAQQVYKAIASIRESKMNKEEVASIMGQEYANILSKKMPGSLTNGKGKNPQELAVENGYNSVQDFLNDVYNAKSKKDAINEIVDSRLSFEDSQYIAEDVLFETKALGTQEAQIAIELSKKLGLENNKVLSDSAIKQYAKSIIYNMEVKAARQTYNFLSSARSVYKKERDAILRGDFEKALEYNTQARTNIAMAQESRKIDEYIKNLENKIDNFVKVRKTNPRNPIARYWVNVLGYNYKMQKQVVSLWQDKDINDIVEYAQENGIDIDMKLLYGKENYKELTYNMFTLLAEQMETIIYMERELRKIETAKGKIELEELANEISDSIYENNKARKENPFEDENKQVSTIKKFFTSMLKADTILRLLDGDTLGITWESILEPINNATHDFNRRMKPFKEKLKELYSVYSPEELSNMREKKYVIKGFSDYAITKEKAIAIALNTGNESNLARLKKGYESVGLDDKGELTDSQIEAVKAFLDKKDWQFIQGVWNYFETFQKESFDLEEKLTGVRPKAIEATPVETEYGTFRGGYYPIVYDSSKSGKAPASLNLEDSKGVFNMPSVAHGSMKNRQGEGLKIPLRLDLDVIGEKLSETIHNLAFREPVRNVSKILRHSTVRKAIENTAGVHQYKALQDWLVDVAGGSPVKFSGAEWYANWARTSMSVMSMGYKLSTIMTQLAGAVHAIPEIGTANVLKGTVHTLWNMPRLRENLDEVYAKSKVMQFRIENVERDVADYNKKIFFGGNKVIQGIKENAFTPMGYIQLIAVDLPVWRGAYEKGLKDFNGDERKAIQYADNAVEITQGSGATKDLAAIQRGSEFQKLFTMYYTFFSAVYQQMYRRTTILSRKKDLQSAWGLANYMLVGMVLSNLVSELLAGRWYDEEEEDDSFAEWALKLNLLYPFQSMPFVRDVANGLLGDYGYSLSAAETAPETVIRGIKKVVEAGYDWATGEADEIDYKDVTLSALKGVGYATKNPIFGNQTIGTMKELFDYLDGTDPEFEAWRILLGKKN